MSMSTAQSAIVLEDIFEIVDKDPDGKKFDKVSRIKGKGDLYEMDVLLDVNTDLYPMEVGEKFLLALSPTLNTDKTPMSGHFDATLHSSNRKEMLSDKFEYVMHGKIFKFRNTTQAGQPKVEVTISFGGLLLQIVGDASKLEVLELDTFIFLLIRKAS